MRRRPDDRAEDRTRLSDLAELLVLLHEAHARGHAR
jgi:hypothetical protein